MSRSTKKKPFGWVGSCERGQMKKWKASCNRKIRRVSVSHDIPDGTKYRRISGDLWDSPSDGRINMLKWFEEEWKVWRK